MTEALGPLAAMFLMGCFFLAFYITTYDRSWSRRRQMPKDRERLLAEKSAWEEIWGIEEAHGLTPERIPLPTRPNPAGTMDSGPRFSSLPRHGTASTGPHIFMAVLVAASTLTLGGVLHEQSNLQYNARARVDRMIEEVVREVGTEK